MNIYLKAEMPLHLKNIHEFLGGHYYSCSIETIPDGYIIKYMTLADMIADHAFHMLNDYFLGCYGRKIMVCGNYISMFCSNVISSYTPTDDVLNSIKEHTGDFLKDYQEGLKDNAAIIAEYLKDNIRGYNGAYLDESILAVDMGIVKYLYENNIFSAEDFI